ncbi:uncharacterized protein LOC105160099 isoform X2 [Sesamum indicum]|uniref:Uncharacterized protein LOC105160099 isoform X2 n=1 Tax=Sesamum indicum TaxID=4182 RepID=A0A6I9T151_SESIN|nr:uncharacterized protein LOC105160099 isoform X2 [Sesamum indicum]
MDLWVVAAAAGAGYIAKNLQNLPGDRKESLTPASYKHSFNVQSESRNFLQQFRDKTCPLRRLARKRAQDDDFLDVENHSDVSFSEIDPISSRNIEASDDYNMGWGSSVSSAVSAEEKSLEFEDGENRIFSRTNRGKFIRNRRNRMNSLRPVQSFGSFLDSQLFGEHENIEDSSSFPSMSTIRPVLVTDGSQMISKLVESVEEIQKKPEKCTGKLQLSGSSDGAAGRSFHSQGPETMLLFITGMMVGILSATTAWKNEAEKLNSQLEQMQNLVQDLYEELDMKEMVMVKELSDEPPGENDTPQDSIVSPTDVKVKKLAEFDSLKANDRNTENLELLSKIEAELEAELEMLENNYKASALERISGVVELDPDFEPDIIQRDLKSTMDNGMSESGDETTDTTTHGSPPANYTVSPWELSLRLHELIESRLQMRIKELETALCNSQNRVQILGSQSIVSGRRFSYCTTESSSVQQSPTEEHDKQYGPSAENQEKETNGILLRVREKDQESQDGEYSSNAGKHSIDRLMPQIAYQDTSTSFMSDEDCLSEDNETDESEMLLIKQILERRKSGSSCNLKID